MTICSFMGDYVQDCFFMQFGTKTANLSLYDYCTDLTNHAV